MTKILLIEDEAPLRYNILELLKAENFDAQEASCGQAGILLAKQELPDLIVCDIMMPDLDGYGVLRELRSQPATAMIPFIFLTAKTERNDFRLGMELGADDYLTKPCTPAELLAAISARLKKHAAYMQQSSTERQRAKGLQRRVRELQQLSDTKEDLLQRLCQDLRDPLSNITMAIQLLKIAASEPARQRYLQILQEECAREIALLNQLSNLQDLLSPENAKILLRLNLFREQNDEKDSSH